MQHFEACSCFSVLPQIYFESLYNELGDAPFQVVEQITHNLLLCPFQQAKGA